MLRSSLLVTLTAMLFLASPLAAHHIEFPSELEQYLEPLPDGSTPDPAGSDDDVHSENMFLVANHDDGGKYRQGTDIAFWGNLAVLGNYNNPGGFRLFNVEDPSNPVKVGQFACRGPQSDVSIWRDLVFVSVDSPMESPECGASFAGTTQVSEGKAFEGIRIVSIADAANPKQIAFVDTDCGSHTHTLVPDDANKRLLIYVLSYPLGGQSTECNAETHRKISVVEVRLNDPASAQVISTPDVSPAIGCHDVTVFMPRQLAAAACITESQMWDISDPANPRVISHIVNPAINIHHSSTFDWGGSTLVIGDELGGAAVSPGCVDGDEHLPLGALWFYDVSDPTLPLPKSSYSIPQEENTIFCTAHNFNTVPTRNDRDILVSAWYNGGTTVLDYTDPADVKQLGFYVAKDPKISAAWSSYWYRGYVYANNFDEDVNSLSPQSRGLDVFAFGDPATAKAYKFNRLNAQTMEELPK